LTNPAPKFGSPTQAPPPAIVPFDHPCIRCSYNLRGLPTSALCPECATAIEQSFRGDLLRFASRGYVRALHTGLVLVLGGTVLYWTIFVMMVIAMKFALPLRSSPFVLVALGWLAAAKFGTLIGYWLFTAPDPGSDTTESTGSARRLLRVILLVQTTLAGFWFLAEFLFEASSTAPPSPGPTTPFSWRLAAGLVGLSNVGTHVIWIAHLIASMLYTQRLARRIPSRRIAARSRFYLWLLPATYGLGAWLLSPLVLVALALQFELLYDIRSYLKVIRAQQFTDSRIPRPVVLP
jgi:hypothetical protein